MEVLSERTEYSQTFANPDGSRTLEETLEPVRVRKGGLWVPVDNNLKASAEGVAPRAPVLPVVFSAGGTGPMARLSDAGRELAVSWPGRLPAPVITGDTAVYHDVLPGVDLRVTASALGFSHVLVVRTKQAAASPKLASLSFSFTTKGLRVGPADGGGLSARDGKGKDVFTAPALLMWDSSSGSKNPGGAEEPTGAKSGTEPVGKQADSWAHDGSTAGVGVPDGARRSVIPVRVSGSQLVITPDRKMLADPSTRYPIYIDPAWTGSISGNAWTSVWSKHKTSSFWKNSTALYNGKTLGSAGAGRTEDCTGCADHIIRSLFRMDTSKVRGKQIIGATFRVEQKWSWTCSPKSNAKLWMTGSISSGTTWNKQPTWYGTPAPVQTAANRKVGSAHGCLGSGTIEFNATSMVAKAAASNWTTLTLGLRAVSESTLNQWKRFNHASPKLAITYNTPPSAPGGRLTDERGCATGSARPYVRTLTPKLAATGTDPDSDNALTTSFYYWQQGGSRNETNKLSKLGGNKVEVPVTIPAGKLTDGQTYIWQARTADARVAGAWSATCEFAVDVTAPPTPQAVASSDYPSASPDTTGTGGVGVAGEFVIAAPAISNTDVVGYAWTVKEGTEPTAANQVAAAGAQGATISYQPIQDGLNTLRVWTKDRAGWYSATPFTYTFRVRPGSGPAAEWHFDETDGAASDATAHGNSLALGGDATRTPGRSGVGLALSLNGTSASATLSGSVMTPHPDTGMSTPVKTDSSFTISAWVRLTATGGTRQQTIIAANGSRTSAYALSYSGPDNKWRFTVAGTDADSPALFSVLSNAAPTAGKWTHLAGVFNTSTNRLTLYVNGVAQTATATPGGGFNATASVTVGKRRWAGVDDGFLNGAVDDIRVSSYPVPAADIALLAVPLRPAISFPNGDTISAGQPMTVRFDAGGDSNVTSYRYSINSLLLDSVATPPTPGGPATVSVPTSASGTVRLNAVAADGAGGKSGLSKATFTVVGGAHLAGIVLDGLTTEAVVGAAVTLTPGGLSATTGDDGRYEIADITPGTYTIMASHGGPCGRSIEIQDVDISGEAWLDLPIMPVTDELGHTCAVQARAFTAVEQTVLGLTGDDAVAEVELPFAFPFYGASYREVWVDTNGVVSFDDPGGSHPYPGGGLPTAEDPSNLVAAFWDDLVVDSSASVRTAVSGTGADEKFTIEWRNVHRKASTAQRLSFEVTLAADGTVATNYAGLDNDAERGAAAAVGIEAPAGEDGLTYSAGAPVLASDRAVVFDHPGEDSPIDVYQLSGTLVDAAGAPVAGATVRLDPSGLSTTTGPGGAWGFDGLVADSYALSASTGGRCARVAREQVELAANTTLNLRLGPDYDELGYACAVGASGYVSASTALALTGDDVAASADLPFGFTFHGRPYNAVWVYSNGLLSFGPAASPDVWANPTLPTADAPNNLVAPFWEDLNVDASASVRTVTQGSAPNRSWVVEWRNVLLQGTADRVSFEVVLYEDGRIAFHYGAMSTPPQQGAGATVGLETVSGTVAALYSFQEASLLANTSIGWTPAAAGTVSGTVTTAVTGEPVAGVPVRLEPGGSTTTTGADGGYTFAGLPVGEYTVATSTGDQRCAGQHARATVNLPGGTADADLSLMTVGDEGGYLCATGTQAFVPGDVVQDWTGDETVWQAPEMPFSVKLYGNTYTSAWISANGLITFKDPAYFGWIGSWPGTLPSEAADGVPNAAVYVHWDDWIVDAQADIATGTVGTAPNRKWVVEWRNVVLHDDPSLRTSFEAIFDEATGEITLAYADIDPASTLERGSGATVGIENASGTIAFQYQFKEALLASGQGVRFTPTPPGYGTLSGTVSCQGEPVAGATVMVAGRSASTGADGSYTVADVPAGTHAVLATLPGGACAGTRAAQVTVGTNTERVVDFPAVTTPAGAGYTLTEQPDLPFVAAGTALALTGDDAYTQVTAPFPITLFGQTYGTGWVDTNGLVSFADPGEPSPDAWPIPSPESPEEPNAAVYPFWHDWVVDAEASVRTATVGASPNRRWVVEWRNVYSYEDPTTRVSFEVVFDESGGFEFGYADNDGTFLELGGGATIGIENADGTVALQYTYRQPVLRPGHGLRFTRPAS